MLGMRVIQTLSTLPEQVMSVAVQCLLSVLSRMPWLYPVPIDFPRLISNTEDSDINRPQWSSYKEKGSAQFGQFQRRG